MNEAEVKAHFTRADGSYHCARWGRPIAPVVFGVEKETLNLVKGAIQAMCALANHEMAETDPELGSNFMWFFFREWSDLLDVPNLDRMISDMGHMVTKLEAADANQYRVFRFDDQGGIKAAFVFLKMDEQLQSVSADLLALNQVVQSMVLWSNTAFQGQSPMAYHEGQMILRPEIGNLIRAIYDPALPAVAKDPSHALRLSARLSKLS